MARIISVASGKGGVGKTTITLNLGMVLSKHFKKDVTVIDCNVDTSHVSLYLGMHFCPLTLNKVLREELDIEEATYEHFSGLDVIPASLSLSELKGIDMSRIGGVIEEIAEKNDVILLDTSPGIGRKSLSVLKASDEVIFVTIPYVPSVMDVIRFHQAINDFNVKPVGIVLNMVRGEEYEISPADVEELTGLPVISSVPYDNNVNKSLALEMPIVALDPKSGASKQFFKLGADIIGEDHGKGNKLFNLIRNLKPKS